MAETKNKFKIFRNDAKNANCFLCDSISCEFLKRIIAWGMFVVRVACHMRPKYYSAQITDE